MVMENITLIIIPVWHTLNKNYTLQVLLFHNFHNTINFPLLLMPWIVSMAHNNWVTVKLSINILQWHYFRGSLENEKWAHDGIRWLQVSTFVSVAVIINGKPKNKEWNTVILILRVFSISTKMKPPCPWPWSFITK